MKTPQAGSGQTTNADKTSAAAIIAEAAHELEQLADVAGLEVVARLLGLVKAEAKLKMEGGENKPSGQ